MYSASFPPHQQKCFLSAAVLLFFFFFKKRVKRFLDLEKSWTSFLFSLMIYFNLYHFTLDLRPNSPL